MLHIIKKNYNLIRHMIFQLGRQKTREWKRGSSKNAGVKIAGVENAAPDCRGGKRGSNEYGKPKFPLFNIVTSGLQQPIELI